MKVGSAKSREPKAKNHLFPIPQPRLDLLGFSLPENRCKRSTRKPLPPSSYYYCFSSLLTPFSRTLSSLTRFCPPIYSSLYPRSTTIFSLHSSLPEPSLNASLLPPYVPPYILSRLSFISSKFPTSCTPTRILHSLVISFSLLFS